MQSRQLIWPLILAGGATLYATSAGAQNVPPGAYMPMTQAVDIVAGQNRPGPYTLGWNHFESDLQHRVTVVVDGLTQPSDSYTIDVAKGTITFATPLKNISVARIEYSYNLGSAKRNVDYSQAPVTVPLLRAGDTNFQLTALPASGGDGQTRLVYGIDRKMGLFGGGLSSKALLANGGTSLDVGYRYGGARNGFDADFSRTEKDFASRVGKSLNLAGAMQKLALGGHLHPTNYFGLGFTRGEQHDLASGGDHNQQGLNVTLGGVAQMPTLNYARTEDTTGSAAASLTGVTTDKVDLAAKVGSAAALVANGQRVVTDAPGSSSDVTAQNASVSLTAATKDNKSKASVSFSGGDKQTAASVEENQDLQIKLQPAPMLTLSAEQKAQKSSLTTGDGSPVTASQTALAAEVTPLPTTKLTGTLETNTNGDTRTSVTNLNAQVGTGGTLELGGGITDRSNSASSTLDTTHAQLALRPLGKAITLTGGYIWNPEKDGKVSEATRQELAVNAKVGALELGSGYSLTTLTGLNLADDLPDPQFGAVSLSLGLRLGKFTTLKGDYHDTLLYAGASRQPQAIAPRGSRGYGLGFTHNVGPAFNLSMNGSVSEDKSQTISTPDYKAQATIGAKF
jgi:hypothetical protein